MSETSPKTFALPPGMLTFRALLAEKMLIHEACDLQDELGDTRRRFNEPPLDEWQAHEEAVVRLMTTLPAADLDDAMAMLAVAFERLDGVIQPGEWSDLDTEDCRHAHRLAGAALRYMLDAFPSHSRLLDASVARLGGWFGSAKAAEPDPLVEIGERNRRLGEEFDGMSAEEADANPERFDRLEKELTATTDAIFDTEPKSLAGAVAKLRRVVFELENGFGPRRDKGHERALRSLLTFLEART